MIVLKLKMDNSEVWKDCIGAVSNLIDEVNLEFSEDGVMMKAMDPSHVALADFKLSSDALSEYDLEAPLKLGVDLAEMDKVLSRAGRGDEFVMEFDEDENRLRLIFKGDSTRRFSLPLLEIEEEELPEPDLAFTASAKVTAGTINDGLKDAALVGDNVKFELTENEFVMKIESDTGSAELELPKGSPGLQELEVNEPSEAMYNIGYLEDMIKAAASNDLVKINHGVDLPIQVIFDIADGNGHLKFLLAPRVETE